MKKNSWKLLGIIALAAVIGLGLAGCKDDPAPGFGGKTLEITDIPSGTGRVIIGIFSTGSTAGHAAGWTTLADSDTSGGEATLSGTTVTANLYVYNDDYTTSEWTGNGLYDIWVKTLDGYTTFYRMQDVSFDANPVTVSFNDFTQTSVP